MNRVTPIALILCLLLLSGCAGRDPTDLRKEMIGVVDRVAETLEKADDVASARPELEKQGKKYAELKMQAAGGRVTTEEEAAITQSLQRELDRARGRLREAQFALSKKDPNGAKDLQEALSGLGK